MSQSKIDEGLRSELAAVAEGLGCDLLHLEYAGGILRLVIDRPDGGVGIDDCATVSRQTSALLDVLDFNPGRYVLEVTSPGLDRPIYRPEEYGRFAGRLARVTFEDPESGKRRTVVGRLDGYDANAGIVTLVEKDREERLELPLDQISKARLEIEL